MLAAIPRAAGCASVGRRAKGETGFIQRENVTLTGRINDTYALSCIFDTTMSNFFYANLSKLHPVTSCDECFYRLQLKPGK